MTRLVRFEKKVVEDFEENFVLFLAKKIQFSSVRLSTYVTIRYNMFTLYLSNVLYILSFMYINNKIHCTCDMYKYMK